MTMTEKFMVCLDVDGTIVDHTGELFDPVREAARAVVEAGHTVIVATGRSLPATLPVAEALGIDDGHVVSSNGGVTAQLNPSLTDGHAVVDRRTFDPEPALRALRQELPVAKFAIETDSGEFLSNQRFRDRSFGVAARGVSLEEMMETQTVRLVVFSTDSTAEEFGRAVKGIGLSGVTYSVGWSAWLDIAAHGVSKGSALESLRERLAIPHHKTVAVGDGRNDIEMLSWAGRGVAMGQAVQEVRAAAGEVTGSVDEHGLADVLNSLL